jgi:hypothetical protein
MSDPLAILFSTLRRYPMRSKEILVLMEYWSHCHECGALMVTVPGGCICPHCGFELEDPEE